MGIRGLFLISAALTILPAGVTSLVGSWAFDTGAGREPAPVAGLDSGSSALGALDRNEDGRISRKEHGAGAEAIFRSLDTDADGFVDASEIESARHRSAEPGMLDAGVAARIAAIDENGDDLLSAEEHAAAATAIFDRFDADADGFLSFGEIRVD